MEDHKPHKELRTAILEGLLHEHPSFSAGLAALDSLFEQLEALRELEAALREIEKEAELRRERRRRPEQSPLPSAGRA